MKTKDITNCEEIYYGDHEEYMKACMISDDDYDYNDDTIGYVNPCSIAYENYMF